jgi:hypothetical protein
MLYMSSLLERENRCWDCNVTWQRGYTRHDECCQTALGQLHMHVCSYCLCNCPEMQKFIAHLATLGYVLFGNIPWSAPLSWVYAATELHSSGIITDNLYWFQCGTRMSWLSPACHNCRWVCEKGGNYLTSSDKIIYIFSALQAGAGWSGKETMHRADRQELILKNLCVLTFPHCHHIFYCALRAARKFGPLQG